MTPDQKESFSKTVSLSLSLTLTLTLTLILTRTLTRTLNPNPHPTPNQVTRISDNLSVQRDARDLELYNKVLEIKAYLDNFDQGYSETASSTL